MAYSEDKIVQLAIQSAISDRDEFAACYGNEGPEAMGAQELAKAFALLKGKQLKSFSKEELETSRLMLIYAEQYERSVHEALMRAYRDESKKALASANRFMKLRLKRWGKTSLEQMIEACDSVPTISLFKR